MSARSRIASRATDSVSVRQVITRSIAGFRVPTSSPTESHSAASRSGAISSSTGDHIRQGGHSVKDLIAGIMEPSRLSVPTRVARPRSANGAAAGPRLRGPRRGDRCPARHRGRRHLRHGPATDSEVARRQRGSWSQPSPCHARRLCRCRPSRGPHHRDEVGPPAGLFAWRPRRHQPHRRHPAAGRPMPRQTTRGGGSCSTCSPTLVHGASGWEPRCVQKQAAHRRSISFVSSTRSPQVRSGADLVTGTLIVHGHDPVEAVETLGGHVLVAVRADAIAGAYAGTRPSGSAREPGRWICGGARRPRGAGLSWLGGRRAGRRVGSPDRTRRRRPSLAGDVSRS